VIPAETKRLLKNRNFLLLWTNHTLQQIAYSMVNFAMMIWVFELTGINLAVSLWAMAFLIPSVSLSVVAGVAADNFDRRKIMITTDLLWGLTVLCFIFARNSFPLILLITLFAQGIDEFFFPSQSAALPRIVSGEELLPANSLFALTIYAAMVVGLLLAGPLLRFFGFYAPFALAAFLIFLGALSVSFLPPLKAVRRGIKTSVSFSSRFRRDLRDELLVLARRRDVFITGMFLALLYGGMGAAGAVAPGFMEQSLKIDARDLSFIGVIPGAAGLVLGTMLIGKFGNRWGEKKMIKAGLLVFGLALLLLAASPSLRTHFASGVEHSFSTLMDYSSRRFGVGEIPIPFEHLPGFSLMIGLLAFTLGTSLTLITVPVAAALQRITPDAARGRTFGTFNMLTSIMTAFFVISAGATADLFNPSFLVAFVGLVAVLFAFFREKLLGLVFSAVKGMIE